MNTNLYMVRGDTFIFSVEIEGLTENLTSAYFSCKKNYDDENYIFQKSIGNGITKLKNTETGMIYEVELAPEDTADVQSGNYFYDFQIEVDGNIFTPLNAILKIDKDVTRPVNVSA